MHRWSRERIIKETTHSFLLFELPLNNDTLLLAPTEALLKRSPYEITKSETNARNRTGEAH